MEKKVNNDKTDLVIELTERVYCKSIDKKGCTTPSLSQQWQMIKDKNSRQSMAITKKKKQTIQDSSIFKAIQAKGTCSIDAGRADRKLNISDEVKFSKEIMFWNPFTELHPEDWNDMIKADIRAMNRERTNL